MAQDRKVYEVVMQGPMSARLLVTVEDGVVTRAESPTHGCFDANFIGQPWTETRKDLEADGFTVHGGH